MIRMELADIWDLHKILDIKWECTDFANEFAVGEYLGYAVINVDAGGIGYDIIGKDNDIYSLSTLCENVALRPSMKYSYVSEFCENKKELGNGLYEVTFGEYPQSKINENVDIEKLVKTGNEFTVKQNGKLVKLYELVDELGNKMVNLNGNFYKVEPIAWIASEFKDIMITKSAINGGFAYNRAFTAEEELSASIFDKIPRKLSMREVMLSRIRSNDETLVESFVKSVLSNEILNDEVIDKIRVRNIEKAKKEKEEKERLAQIKKEKRRIQNEKNRIRRQRRRQLDYFFPRDAWAAMWVHSYSEEDMKEIRRIISEELPKLKFYVDDKDKLINIIVDLYLGKDAQERRMPYPKERYEACRSNLEGFDVDYLNIVLKETIGRNKSTEKYVEYLINNPVNFVLTK